MQVTIIVEMNPDAPGHGRQGSFGSKLGQPRCADDGPDHVRKLTSSAGIGWVRECQLQTAISEAVSGNYRPSLAAEVAARSVSAMSVNGVFSADLDNGEPYNRLPVCPEAVASHGRRTSTPSPGSNSSR